MKAANPQNLKALPPPQTRKPSKHAKSWSGILTNPFRDVTPRLVLSGICPVSFIVFFPIRVGPQCLRICRTRAFFPDECFHWSTNRPVCHKGLDCCPYCLHHGPALKYSSHNHRVMPTSSSVLECPKQRSGANRAGGHASIARRLHKPSGCMPGACVDSRVLCQLKF